MPSVSRDELAAVFRDTLRFIENNEVLREAEALSIARTKFYGASFREEVSVKKAGEVRVIQARTFEAALKLHKEFPGKRIAVLNFAASTKPGGGVWGGSYAQEESLCRCSTLYNTLDSERMKEAFYYPHRDSGDTLHGWDDCIYSPDVVICKNDTDGLPERLDPQDFVKVDVITCAAPHIHRGEYLSNEEVFRLQERRARNILRVCAYNRADIFVGGAFGCGAFKNPAKVVAGAWRSALNDYREKFDLTAFAIYVSDYPGKKQRDTNSLQVFCNEFEDASLTPNKRALVESFRDTLSFIEENETLRDAVRASTSRTRFFPAHFREETPARKTGDVCVVNGRTLQTALTLHKEFPAKKIAVLNFADALTPGGKIWKGSNAQEESLCRSSTLYPTLDNEEMKSRYYRPNRNEGDTLHGWDDCIYSPGVIICKDDSDTIPSRLSPQEFVSIDVVTCAAPFIHEYEYMPDSKLFALHESRARNIMRVCAFNNADIFIGGAFGCGVFRNNPEVAARAWRSALKDYRTKFDLVSFAVYSYHDTANFDIFSSIIH